MEKDFDRWNDMKKALDRLPPGLQYHEREIWWCSIGINVGSEQHSQTGDFSRPVLIFKRWSPNIFWGIPLTTKIRDLDFRYRFALNGVENDALLTQLRSFDSRRLLRKVSVLSEKEFNFLNGRLSFYLEKTEPAQEGAGSSEAEATV